MWEFKLWIFLITPLIFVEKLETKSWNSKHANWISFLVLKSFGLTTAQLCFEMRKRDYNKVEDLATKLLTVLVISFSQNWMHEMSRFSVQIEIDKVACISYTHDYTWFIHRHFASTTCWELSIPTQQFNFILVFFVSSIWKSFMWAMWCVSWARIPS